MQGSEYIDGEVEKRKELGLFNERAEIEAREKEEQQMIEVI